MVVKNDGTKWACMSCLKGHRVSGCTHVDRELVLVPKKGRPVTQCHHCRQERKKRSAHVKCDCGENEKPHHPREKCIHLREAEERAKAGLRDIACEDKDPAHLVAVAEEQGCCCHHGGKCSCSLLRREFKDVDGLPHGPAVKPRLESTRSDGFITIFQNGHHKPVHRKNHAAHEAGMPYKVPLPRTNTDQGLSRFPRRSVDSLAASHSMTFDPTAFVQQIVSDAADGSFDSSHQHSPNSQNALSPPALTDLAFARSTTVRPVERSQSASGDLFAFPAIDNVTPINDTAFEHWSMSVADMSAMPNNNPFGVWPTNMDVNAVVQPALTAASSGTQSEIDEIPTVDDGYGFGMPSIQEDATNIHFANVTSSPQSNRRSLPPNFFSQTDFALPINGEWSDPSNADLLDGGAKSSKTYSESPSMAFIDPWQLPSVTQPIDNTVGLGPNRPASHSIGPGGAPTDDVMQQLFPEININDDAFASGSPMHVTHTSAKSYGLGDTASTDFGNFDVDVAFAESSWPDSTIGSANDPFNTTFDLHRDPSNPDFNNVWSQ